METPVSLINPDLSGNELKYVTEAVETGWITHRSKYNAVFEERLSIFLGRKTLACSSGTAAIHLALMSATVGRGEKVIVPALGFGTAVSAILAVGAKPVFVDVNENGCIDPTRVQITKKTAAIIPVHLYGEQSEVNFGLTSIEDSCEAFGFVKPSADYTCYSFFVNKLITTGEGGAIISRSPEFTAKLRDGGFDHEYKFWAAGLNYRMTGMQAAMGIAQMERVETFRMNRLKIAAFYKSELPGFGKWMFATQTERPIQLMRDLADKKIETRRVFYPLNKSPAFFAKGKFPMAEKLYRHGLLLPTDVTKEQAEYVVECVRGSGSAPIAD